MNNIKSYLTTLQLSGLLIGIAGFIILFILPVDPSNIPASHTAAVVFLMVAWWMTEAIPLAVTSMLPLVLFPLLGILDMKETSSSYINNIIFLFLGAFIISIAIERWNLHRRISLNIIKLIGGGPSRILLSVMVSAWFLSMFINNTSTTMLILPIAVSIILQLESLNNSKLIAGFSTALVLGVAYASSIGGIATLIGTVPNMVFVRIFESTFPLAPKISFTSWMLVALPISTVLILLTWLLLRFLHLRKSEKINIDKDTIRKEYESLGPMSFEEKTVAALMTITALLWIFRSDLNIGSFTIPGWSNILTFGKMIDDSTIAIFIALSMFLIPTKNKKGEFIANPDMLIRIPWDVIILFGGGFAVADAFQSTGLAKMISSNLSVLSNAEPIIVIFVICTLMTFLTELTSNTATTQTILPILAATAVAMQVNPLLFMIPATISASMAFMLPVATPPNAIIFSTGRIKIQQMSKAGFILNWIGIVVISLMFYYLGMLIFGINPTVFPYWGIK